MITAILVIALVLVGGLTYKLFQDRQSLTKANSALISELERFRPIKDIEAEASRIRSELDSESSKVRGDLAKAQKELETFKALAADYELKVDLEEASFYQPKFGLQNTVELSQALDLVREAEKEVVRQKQAIAGAGSQELGKLALASFNGDASAIIESVTYSNFEKCKEKLRIAFNKANNLLASLNVELQPVVLDLKLKEMALVYDLKEAEQKAKEEQAALKEQMREEEAARAEAEKARLKAIQEQERYEAALEQARTELESKSADERGALEKQIADLQAKLTAATEERERATSMAQITRRGHVYIISNVGSFGDKVLKIGMTRRKDPNDRIIELGDASVPFAFDVHAMVMADDAPALENALHKEFDSRRVNKVNTRKEFFRVELDEITQVCDKLGFKVQLTMLAEAREFRETMALEAQTTKI